MFVYQLTVYTLSRTY